MGKNRVQRFDDAIDGVNADIVQYQDPTARPQRRRGRGDKSTPTPPTRNLLVQETVPMTVIAQDTVVGGRFGVSLTRIPVPADRLQRGPRNHRFHVVDVAMGSEVPGEPVLLHHPHDPWAYDDRWADNDALDPVELADSREFRAQNVFAIAAHTLAVFERHLGRPISWQSGWPHLYLVPTAKLEANAHYSRTHAGVLFGWLPAVGNRPALYTALSFDIIAHEVSHAILDGLRPKYTEPGLPDQRAFHEALADLVALFSVFEIDGVAERLLDPDRTGAIVFSSDAAALSEPDPVKQAELRAAGRAEFLKQTPLAGLAEQLGAVRSGRTVAVGDQHRQWATALRRSVMMTPNLEWRNTREFRKPHRRAEVLVAAFMQTFVTMWAGRLEPLRTDGGVDVARVAEEGVKSARHMLGMLLRALDYFPPVELEFEDVIDSVITADKRLCPEDDHHYRDALTSAFESFGIKAPAHRIVDEDGIAAPLAPSATGETPEEPEQAAYRADPDAEPAEDLGRVGIRYEHLNLAALRTSREEMYQFIWSNAGPLGIDVRLTTQVERVIASTRVGPDGLFVTEILADYTQRLKTAASTLPPGITAPEGMDPNATVELWGGGVLVFDQFGRFRLHQRKPILDVKRQTERIKYLYELGLRDRSGDYGSSDGVSESRPFAMLHEDSTEDGW